MAGGSGDKVSMPSDIQLSASFMDAKLQSNARSTTRSVSMSTVVDAMGPYRSENSLVSFTGPLNGEKREVFIPMSGPLHASQQSKNFGRAVNEILNRRNQSIVETVKETGQTGSPGDDFTATNERLLRSGPLGRCNDPFCTTCPMYYDFRVAEKKHQNASASEYKFNVLYGDAKGWAEKSFTCLKRCIPGIMNPHTKLVQQWNQFFVISCLVAIFVDPFFFFLLAVQQDNRCISFNWSLARAIVVVRSITDFIYFLHMLLQFRLAYVAPETRVVGAGDLVDQPKKIAAHYLRGSFLLDVFVVLPLPQIMILVVIPDYVGPSAANYAKNLLRVTVLLQYIPRMLRCIPLLAGQSSGGFIFESAWANFFINLLMFMLAGHVVGSLWYLFGVQRVNQCLRDVCSEKKFGNCTTLIDCEHWRITEDLSRLYKAWQTDQNASDCFISQNGPFSYGIYTQVVIISTKESVVKRYIYSLFWGFQQISTLAGNQIPSDFVWEVLFTMGIVGLGLFLFALLIGNMQNFLQSLGRRRLEMQLRRRDVEQWMSHRRLPEELRRRVRQSERFNWAANHGVNEAALIENLPEDLQREIRRHLFTFVKKVRIFTLMVEPILDAICERLKPMLYIRGSIVLCDGGLINKMVFIVRGKMESVGADGNRAPLAEGDVCGEELLTWCLEHSSVGKDGKKFRSWGQRLISNRNVLCLTNVEAFALRADDLEEVTGVFSRFLRNPHVQAAIRYESPYWRTMAAICIQVAWRYRKKRLSRKASYNPQPSNLTM